MENLQNKTKQQGHRIASKMIYLSLFIGFFFLSLNYYATERRTSKLFLSTYINLHEYFYTNGCLVCPILQGKLNFLKQSMPSFLSTAGTCFLFKLFDNTRDSIRIPLEVTILMCIFEFFQIIIHNPLINISMNFDWLDIVSIALGGFIGTITIKTIEVTANEKV